MKLYELLNIMDKRTQCLIYIKGYKITWTPFMIKDFINLSWYSSNSNAKIKKVKVINCNLIKIQIKESEGKENETRKINKERT